VLGDSAIGTCFDVQVIPSVVEPVETTTYRMFFSWRPQKSIAMSESKDGVHWSPPAVIFGPNSESGWEDIVNRQCIVAKDGKLNMWYTGQCHFDAPAMDTSGHPAYNSYIGYAVSELPGADGKYHFVRQSREPVLWPETASEGMSVMNPCVLWDEKIRVYKMWYSAGEAYEPNVICYAESEDGLHWRKHRANPVMAGNRANKYEQQRIGGCDVHHYKDGYLFFYIGYENVDTARICIAWSPDGVSRFERSPHNPIVSPTPDGWDADACYKPSAVYDKENKRWLLWYNGRKDSAEYIGLATHEGEDLGF
jgi:sucrose-6-phosphate hydrolase SacC (GH32 family)